METTPRFNILLQNHCQKNSPNFFLIEKISKNLGKKNWKCFLKNKIENENTNPTFSPFDHDVNVIKSNINYINGCNLDK
jgi:hypothetical protein